ncbi:MAG TPA: hypothetical protein VIV06_09670, partial [Candidatus Limnocylindrales bacterium]
SALATGLLPSVAQPGAVVGAPTATLGEAVPAPSVRHVVRYVQLRPGQTAPPQSTVVAAPKPSPRTVVVTTTRQSGRP